MRPPLATSSDRSTLTSTTTPVVHWSTAVTGCRSSSRNWYAASVRPSTAWPIPRAPFLGRDIDHQVLAQVVDVSEVDLEAALEGMLGGLILERVPGGDRCYRFRHQLLRSVAYELQPETERRGVHGRVADALVSEGVEVG